MLAHEAHNVQVSHTHAQFHYVKMKIQATLGTFPISLIPVSMHYHTLNINGLKALK